MDDLIRCRHGRQSGATRTHSLEASEARSGLRSDPVLQFLAAAFSNPRAGVITRRPGDGWRSEPAAWPLERIAAAVHDPGRIVGIRPEGLIRLLLVDIDRKPDRVSPYWHPYGHG